MGRRRKIIKLPLWFCFIVVLAVVAWYYFAPKNNNLNGENSGNIDSSNTSKFEDFINSKNGSLNVFFLDVGQGDCIIIEFPDDKTMIIDSGDNKSACEQKIKEFTDLLEIERFDYLLLTHADADHVGSMDYIFQNYEVGKVFRPNVLSTHDNASSLNEGINVGIDSSNAGKPASSKAYFDFLYCLQEEGCESEIFNKDSDFTGTYSTESESFEYVFDFLTPVAEKSFIKYTDANDYSPIVTLSYNGTVLLLTGDAETEAEKEFMNYYKGAYPDCDLLKVGHHGSQTSTSADFLSAVKPEFSVIQCGEGNRYDHPRQAVLDRLKNINSRVYRTDTNGDIVVSINCESDYKMTSDKFFCKTLNFTNNFVGADK